MTAVAIVSRNERARVADGAAEGIGELGRAEMVAGTLAHAVSHAARERRVATKFDEMNVLAAAPADARKPPRYDAVRASAAASAARKSKRCPIGQQSTCLAIFAAARGPFVTAFRPAIIRGGLESLYFTGAHRLLQPLIGGIGAILTLHHVRPGRPGRFQPNRLLEITPRFFARVIEDLARSGIDLISLEEMHRRLVERDFARRFVCLTFDDGYRDTLQIAYPILKAQAVPFAVYVATSFPDRFGELWWLALEAVIARNNRIGLMIDGRNRTFDCASVAEKRVLYDELYWWLRARPTEAAMRETIRDLAARYGVDIAALCKELCMSWEELAELAADPLVTIGAHTVTHPMLSKLPEKSVRSEMGLSRSVIEAALAKQPQHLSFPIGDRSSAGAREFAIAAELGFKTAVTSRPGVLFPAHRERLTALPRISLNGEYQRLRYVRVLLSGSATALWSGFRRLEAA